MTSTALLALARRVRHLAVPVIALLLSSCSGCRKAEWVTFNEPAPVFMSEGQERRVPLVAQGSNAPMFSMSEAAAPFARLEGDEVVLTPTYGQHGEYQIVLRATSGAVFLERTLAVTVSRRNRPCVIQAVEPIRISAGESHSEDVYASDPDGDELTFALGAEAPGWARMDIDVLVLSPGYADVGEFAIEVRCTDSGNLTGTHTVEVTVEKNDRCPVFGANPAVSIKEGEIRAVAINVRDDDGDEVTLSLGEGSPPFASLDGTVLELAPGMNHAGVYAVEVSAAAGACEANVRTTLQVTVTDVNQVPTLEPVDDVQVEAGTRLEFDLVAADDDVEDAQLSCALEYAHPWAGVSGYVVTLNPPVTARGTSLVRVRCTDREGAFAERWFRIQVIPEPTAPRLGRLFQRLGTDDLPAGVAVATPPFVGAETEPHDTNVRLEIELRRMGEEFLDEPTHGGAFNPQGSTLKVPLGYLAAGEYRWQAQVVDVNGVTSGWRPFADGEMAFEVEAQPIAGSLTIESFSGYTRHRTVKLFLSAAPSDGASLSTMAFSNDGESFGLAMPFATTATWTLEPGEGEKIVFAEVTDTLDYVGVFQGVVVLDETPPEASLRIAGGRLSGSRTVLLELEASDELSGLRRVCFSNTPDTFLASNCTNAFAPTIEWQLSAGDGPKRVFARVEDVARNSRTVYADVLLDETVPEVDAWINFGAEFTRSRDVQITVEATDARGIANVSFSTDGGRSFGAWFDQPSTVELTLEEGDDGEREVMVRARDFAGNAGFAMARIILDRTPPTLSMQVPAAIPLDGALWVDSNPFPLVVSAGDQVSGVAGVQVSLDGVVWSAAFPVQDVQSWTMAREGPFTLHMRSVDRAGHASVPASVSLVLDSEAPHGEIAVNGGAPVTGSLDVLVSHYALDGGSGPATVSLSNDGLLWAAPLAAGAMAATPWTLAAGPAGERVVWAKFTDRVGNEVIVDARINYQPGQDGAFLLVNDGAPATRERTVTLKYGHAIGGTVDDVCVDDGTTFLCGLPLPLPGGVATTTWQLPDVDGSYEITLGFELPSAQVVFAAASLWLDREGPELLSLEVNGGAGHTRERRVRVTAEADAVGAPPVELCVGESLGALACAAYTGYRSFELSSGDGPKTVYGRVRDLVGNESAPRSVEIVLDTEPPVITNFLLRGGAASTTSREITASVSATGGPAFLSFSQDNGITWGPELVYASSVPLTLSAGPDGDRTVLARVRDAAGNAATASKTIRLDREPPRAVVLVEGGAVAVRNSTVALSFQVSDNFRVSHFCVRSTPSPQPVITHCSAQAWPQFVTSVEGFTLEPGEGTRSVYAYFRDLAGNVVEATTSVVVDRDPPRISFVRLNDGAEYATSSLLKLAVGMTEPEDVLPTLTLETSQDGGATWAPPRPLPLSSVDLQLHAETNGVRTIHVRVTDPAGNASTHSGSIKLDTTPPGGQVVINGGAAETNTSRVKLQLTYADNFAVARYCARPPPDGAAPAASHSCWKPVGAEVDFVLEPGDGRRWVYVHFRDAAGNASPKSAAAHILVKTTPPQTHGFDPDNTYARHRGLELAWPEATDRGTGVRGYVVGWSTDGAQYSWLPEQTATAASLDGLPNGRPVQVRYRAVDDFGHESMSETLQLTPRYPFEFRQRLPAPIDLRAITSPAGGAVFAVGDVGLVLRSSDGGQSWQRFDPMVDDDITDVSFATPQKGVAVTAGGRVLLTRDAGVTWAVSAPTQQPLSSVRLVSSGVAGETFLAAGRGVVLRATLVAYDGSEGWSPVSLPEEVTATTQLRRISVCGASGCLSGGQPVVAIIGDGPVLLRSTNGGAAFTALAGGGQELRSIAWEGGTSTRFITVSGTQVFALNGTTLETLSTTAAPFELRGVARAGGDILVLGSEGSGAEARGRAARFLLSNGTFSEHTVPNGVRALVAATGFDDGTAIAAGLAGSLVKRFGTTWSAIPQSGVPAQWNAAAGSANHVWVAGGASRVGRLHRTSNVFSLLEVGGAAADWFGLHAEDDMVARVVGGNGRVRRTDDGGATFVEETVAAGASSFKAISCAGSGTARGCVAVGAPRAIYFLNRSAGSWSGSTSPGGTELRGVVATGTFASGSPQPMQGVAVGADGRAYRFSGSTVEPVLAVDAEGRGLFGIAARGSVMVAVGAGGWISRSANAGASWTRATTPGALTSDVLAVTHAGGGAWYASAADGRLLRSDDDGESWNLLYAPVRSPLRAIFAETPRLWVAGDAGAVLFGADSGE